MRAGRTLVWHAMNMMDDEFIDWVVAACRGLPNAEAVNLGGSRARGDFRPDSDWDFAVYYRGEIDPRPLEDLGWPGQVFRPTCSPASWPVVRPYGATSRDRDTPMRSGWARRPSGWDGRNENSSTQTTGSTRRTPLAAPGLWPRLFYRLPTPDSPTEASGP